ncbi:hypothetical protein DICPUDRAFT_92049 [Dictyostelium purpureum]|uniref:Uncharacterized protein n=1 Tax=Dictyostelium purpureum TaxID=5786 RepID=F0ZL59_DICPU|nr:uncharacterized protein DICPUDRAFT_92049 [Dictyostelium purpureum]EGC35336.1 hypothetical protein DICPUDRAFT_92049 [Dictyostelium purpureum]|eukprot:XP_003288143.1 hypothetical protein DICPUDRAFT_92049 [Dictyostelium purpureum]
MSEGSKKVGMIILCIIIPPLAVFIRRGCALVFWVNIVLWILGWIPGVIHALWVVLKRDP